jgi:hypothetical protein
MSILSNTKRASRIYAGSPEWGKKEHNRGVMGSLCIVRIPFDDELVYAMPIQKPHRSEAERYSVAVPNYGTIQSVSLYHFGHYGVRGR